MIAGLDSSGFHPSPSQIAEAYSHGVRVWGAYLPGPKIYSGNHKADYDALKAGGMRTIAFASGWADPVNARNLAVAWGVDYLCLDVEGGIRDYGTWTQPWLDASGAGLYANQATHKMCRAPFRILYGTYFNPDGTVHDPQTTWRGTPPTEPHGWQWWNSHNEFGGSVDRSWFDDWFLGDTDMTPEQERKVDGLTAMLQDIGPKIDNLVNELYNSPQGIGQDISNKIDKLQPVGGVAQHQHVPGDVA